MSTSVTSHPTPVTDEHIALHEATPSFSGILGGELFKISRQWTTWIMLLLLIGATALPFVLTLTITGIKDSLNTAPGAFFSNRMESTLDIIRIFIGFFLLVLTARIIGMEYQFGTIRVLLARGVGRIQLLSAKVLAVTIIALIVFALSLVISLLFLYATVFLIAGNFDSLKALDASFWSDTRVFMMTVLVSMGVTILMASAMSVLGRSLAFALSVSLAWFPADNFGTIFLLLANRLTHNDFWLNVTGYLLGPNLNVMPASLLSGRVLTIGAQPFVQVDGTHTLVVSLVYAVIFAVLAIVLMWKRDVKE